MTVAELIKELEQVPQDMRVNLWVDGDRHEVSMVDMLPFGNPPVVIDINAVGWARGHH